jgi:hypothetical protein
VTDLLRRNPLILGLVILCSLLAVVIAVEFVALGAPEAPPAPRKVVPSEAKLLPSVAAISLDAAYPETGARPLWIPTRRPAPAAVVAQPSFQRGQFILQGVTIAGATRIAMLKEKASGRVHRVELGRDVNGLHVAEVEPERVTLAQGAEREVIELRVQRPGGAPAPAGPAPAGPASPARPVPSASQPNPAAAAAPRGAGPFAPPPPAAAPPPPPQPVPGGPGPANPTAGAVPQQQLYVPMTPEELLARRRARRNPSPE